MKRLVFASIVTLFFSSHAQIANAVEHTLNIKDGDLTVPSSYKSWSKFLVGVDRPDVKQVRDIYINPIGSKAKAGEKFPNGSMMVMELYKAAEEADGTLKKTSDGKLVKGALLKVFVMGKGTGWGAAAPEGLKNGDWIYSAYGEDTRTATADDPKACRGCHLPHGDTKDFVARYDEYFQKR